MKKESIGFVHLHVHSEYSILDSTIKLCELFPMVKEYGMEAVALTDHGNLLGAYEFYKQAKRAGIKPIIGCEVYVAPVCESNEHTEKPAYHLVLLAMNQRGYRNLCNLVTKSYLQSSSDKPVIDHELLDMHREGLIVLSGCLESELCSYILSNDFEYAQRLAEKYKEMFEDRYYLEVQANKLPEQEYVNQRIKEIGRRLGIPIVATNDCHYLGPGDAKSHDILLSIKTGTTLKDEKRFRFKSDQYFFKSCVEMLQSLHEFEDAVERTLEVAERCCFEFEKNGYKFPEFRLEAGNTPDQYMTQLAREGLEKRLKEDGIQEQNVNTYKTRLESEIETMNKMGLSRYFLAISDYTKYAKSNGIPVGPGRGSVSGSLVAYTLGITEVDPITHGLLFERFLTAEAMAMTDIDLDFCAERRDEVIRYVIQKYGEDNVARIGDFRYFSLRSLIRKVGRVLEIPEKNVEEVANLIPTFRGKEFNIDDSLSEVPELGELIKRSHQLSELVELARQLECTVSDSLTDPFGLVISSVNLFGYIPLYKDRQGRMVTQFDKYSLEDLGFVHFDLLPLKALTVIDRAVKLINDNHFREDKTRFDVKTIPLDDPDVYELISNGSTEGVFQLESPRMKEFLRRLRPSRFEDIVAVLSLDRSGPIDSGLVDEFIRRKQQERIDYLIPELEGILRDTYGLYIYQEQLMRTANMISGYNMAAANELRRAFGKKKPDEVSTHKNRFVEGAVKKGLDVEVALRIFETMAEYCEYAFNKSHAVAYALITYQTAYLKAHYHQEFMEALQSIYKSKRHDD
jgi:DNA polymerase-3 subunit alpha